MIVTSKLNWNIPKINLKSGLKCDNMDIKRTNQVEMVGNNRKNKGKCRIERSNSLKELKEPNKAYRHMPCGKSCTV